jgi:hypothetical protein
VSLIDGFIIVAHGAVFPQTQPQDCDLHLMMLHCVCKPSMHDSVALRTDAREQPQDPGQTGPINAGRTGKCWCLVGTLSLTGAGATPRPFGDAASLLSFLGRKNCGHPMVDSQWLWRVWLNRASLMTCWSRLFLGEEGLCM